MQAVAIDMARKIPLGATTEAFDVVHAKSLRCLPDLVSDLGGDADALLRQVEIAPLQLAQGIGGVAYRQMVELLELAADQLGCPDFGLRLATLQAGGMYGALGRAMRNSQTFGGALEYVANHSYAHSPASRIWIRRIADERITLVGHEILLNRVPHKAQMVEMLMLAGHLSAKQLTGGQAQARGVHFRHQPLLPAKSYRRYFGCDVRFGQSEDAVLFFDRDITCPVVGSDLNAYRNAIAYIDSKSADQRAPLHAQTRGVIKQFLAIGQCTNDAVAAELNIHPRTLHRRLAAEGTSFHKIKDEVRRDFALYYLLQTRLEFGQISEMLGFAEQSVMTRRCHAWFATSPSGVRSHERYVATPS